MSEQLQQLQAELDGVKAKLAKTVASKQKLKESWALLKEKVINAHSLCDERDALLKQLDEESSERATAQQRLQEALQQKAALDKQYGAAKKQKQRLDELLTAATAEKQHLEKRLAHAVTAADQAKQQYQAALKQQSAAEAAMQTMQRQLNKLQCTVEQLEQQQVIHRLSSLERHWKQLTDREHVVTVDQSALKKAVRPALHELLQRQLEPRLSAAEQCLQLMQQQREQQHMLAPAAGGQQEQQQQLQQQQQLAPQEGLQRLQQLLEAVLAEQQQLRMELATTQQQLAALQHAEVAAQRHPSSGANPGPRDTAAITPLPSLQRPTVSPTALPAGHSVACEPAAKHSEQPAVAAAAKCAGTGSGMQSIRCSSMFGTTVLNIGGSSSSYSIGDQSGSPSEASVHHQFTGHKRLRQEGQQQQHRQVHNQVAAQVQCDSAADSSRYTTCAGARLSVENSTQQHQRYQYLARPTSSSALSSSSEGSESDDGSEQSPKRQQLQQQRQQSVGIQHKAKHRAQQQQEAQQSRAVAKQRLDQRQLDGHTPEPAGQQRLAIHFQALGDQQSDAAAMAGQVAKLVTSGQLHIQDVVKASCDSVLSAAADHYDVTQLQRVVSGLTQQRDSQQDLELLGTVGWASEQHGAAKVIVYHQRLAEYVKQLSDLLLQQLQAGIVGCSSTADKEQLLFQPSVAWPAAATCWQQLLSDLDSLQGATRLDQQTVCSTAIHMSSAHPHAPAVDSSLLHQVVQQLMQPVHRACGAAAAANAPVTPEQAQHQAQHQQQIPLAQACAATAAAVKLLRVVHDRQGFHCIVVKLVLATAQASGCSSSSHSSNSASSTGGLQCGPTYQAGIVHCLACLLAAIGAWQEGLQLDDDLSAYPTWDLSHSSRSRTREEQTWQLLVYDPVLVALSSCLGTLAHRAVAATAAAAARALGQQLDAGRNPPLALLGQGLLAMLSWGAAVASGRQGCADLDATMRDKDQQQASVADQFSQVSSSTSKSGIDGISTQLEPTDLLASLLGLLKLLLHKQHPAVPGSCLVVSEAAWSTCAAGYCVSIRLLAAVAAPEKLAALLNEFQYVLSTADVHAHAQCAHVRQLLGPLLPQAL